MDGGAYLTTLLDPSAAVDGEAIILDPRDPLPSARLLRSKCFNHSDGCTLHHVAGTFWRWDGHRYQELESTSLRSTVYHFTEATKKRARDGSLVPFAPSTTSVNHIIDALSAVSFTRASAPCWLDNDAPRPDPLEIVATPSGLLHLRPDGQPTLIGPSTPLWFSPNALAYEYNPDAPAPVSWLDFLACVFDADEESLNLLQTWFGYVLTGDTRLQKMLLLIGPPRSGKGTIGRVLANMIGLANVAAPTLAGLGTNFGLWSLVGKLLAIISDARLSGRTDQAVVTERLLSISGEDHLTVDIKNREPATVKLPTRIMVMTNELPRLNDASGALANRFLILRLDKSFLGREDHDLTDRLLAELPSILNWAIEGWQLLRQQGRFYQPSTGASTIAELIDLAGPIRAFVRDSCDVAPALTIPVSELYIAYELWCSEQGQEHPPTAAVFGRDLRAAFPTVSVSQPRDGEARIRVYNGISLNESTAAAVSKERMRRDYVGRR